LAKKATSEGKLAPLMTNSRSLPTVQILGALTHDSVDTALEAKLRVPFQATIRSTEQDFKQLHRKEVLNGLDLLWSTSIARIQKIDTISTLEKGMLCLVNICQHEGPTMPIDALRCLQGPKDSKPTNPQAVSIPQLCPCAPYDEPLALSEFAPADLELSECPQVCSTLESWSAKLKMPVLSKERTCFSCGATDAVWISDEKF